jgi:HlyD family secretion protein
LDEIKLFLEKLALALNSANTSASVTQTTIDSWKTDISATRTSVNTAIANHSAEKVKLNTAESALLVAQNELALKQAGSTPEQIEAQIAVIEQAKANINSQVAQVKLKESAVLAVRAKLAKNTLYSPIEGVVTKQSAKIGAIVTANETIISIISDDVFEIEAFVVEADIINLKVGDRAQLSLDAYGEDVLFTAIVTSIDPAAVFTEGVANYKTTLEFDSTDSRIRAGMTADLDIVTAERENVVSIPQRAVILKNNKKIVRILDGDKMREVEVETGIIGGRGLIEIVSGVNEGDEVVTSVKN